MSSVQAVVGWCTGVRQLSLQTGDELLKPVEIGLGKALHVKLVLFIMWANNVVGELVAKRQVPVEASLIRVPQSIVAQRQIVGNVEVKGVVV
mmetsp:Transcript_8702/g.26174  ORF Transcript_8702/g.26174 Transcript_8702/m.26174 type:complete len:92 (-) Transcript_8702:1126-1401(-)